MFLKEQKFISMQGGFTELMLEQIMSSQEDIDHTERGTMQVHNYKTNMCKITSARLCNLSLEQVQFLK